MIDKENFVCHEVMSNVDVNFYVYHCKNSLVLNFHKNIWIEWHCQINNKQIFMHRFIGTVLWICTNKNRWTPTNNFHLDGCLCEKRACEMCSCKISDKLFIVQFWPFRTTFILSWTLSTLYLTIGQTQTMSKSYASAFIGGAYPWMESSQEHHQ